MLLNLKNEKELKATFYQVRQSASNLELVTEVEIFRVSLLPVLCSLI
jgi:hypothetical protein